MFYAEFIESSELSSSSLFESLCSEVFTPDLVLHYHFALVCIFVILWLSPFLPTPFYVVDMKYSSVPSV